MSSAGRLARRADAGVHYRGSGSRRACISPAARTSLLLHERLTRVAQPDSASRPAGGLRSVPTLGSVAERAGVSRATASRALSGSPKVSTQARDAVLRAAAELDYRPNKAARWLATRRSESVAFVVSETEERLFGDPFFLGLLRGAHAEVAVRGYQLLFTISSSAADREQLMAWAAGGHVDGIVLISLHGDDPLPERLEGMGVPVVLSGRPVSDQPLHYVDSDNRGGAHAATTLLVQRGCRRIATITGPQDMCAGQDRLAGFRDALQAEGVRPSRKLVAPGDFTMAGGVQAMRRLLRATPGIDGVFAASDLMAIGAIQALEALGRRVPDDVAVVGFDDVPAALFSQPPLTTVRQPIEVMGRQMARTLLDRIDGRPVRRGIVLPTELVRRASA